MEKAAKEKEQRKIHKKAEKMINYAKIVKEMHWPEISEKKREIVEVHK